MRLRVGARRTRRWMRMPDEENVLVEGQPSKLAEHIADGTSQHDEDTWHVGFEDHGFGEHAHVVLHVGPALGEWGPVASDEDIAAAIERSSLGTPGAKA